MLPSDVGAAHYSSAQRRAVVERGSECRPAGQRRLLLACTPGYSAGRVLPRRQARVGEISGTYRVLKCAAREVWRAV